MLASRIQRLSALLLCVLFSLQLSCTSDEPTTPPTPETNTPDGEAPKTATPRKGTSGGDTEAPPPPPKPKTSFTPSAGGTDPKPADPPARDDNPVEVRTPQPPPVPKKPVKVGADAGLNGSFEDGKTKRAGAWEVNGSVRPSRVETEAHSGKHSMHIALKNEGAAPREGLLVQTSYENIRPGKKYTLSFWSKEMDHGESYVQQYNVKWLSDSGLRIAESGFQGYRGGNNEWKNVEVPNLVAPDQAGGIEIVFRFVTGAVEGGSGEAYIDDVAFTVTE
ncbi:MAG: hypothetical protein AAF517_22775 [Planctomycetota bacterium]